MITEFHCLALILDRYFCIGLHLISCFTGFNDFLVRLLIWEECYYESLSSSILPHNSGIQSSELAFEEWEGRWVTVGAKKSQVGVRAEDKVSSLINKMMSDNRVKVLGQGYDCISFFFVCFNLITF